MKILLILLIFVYSFFCQNWEEIWTTVVPLKNSPWYALRTGDLTESEYFFGDSLDSPPSTIPGKRYGSSSFSKNLRYFLFGGEGFAGSDMEKGLLNDMWEYKAYERVFITLAGNETINPPGSGFSNSFQDTNLPGGKMFASGFVNTNDNFFIIGGRGHGKNKSISSDNIWEFNPNSKRWKFVSGSGQSSPNNTKAREETMVFKLKTSNDIYVFGGKSKTNVNCKFLGDFWKINIISGTWTFLKSNPGGEYSQLDGYVFSNDFHSYNFPSSRAAAATWVHGDLLYMFGGYTSNGCFLEGSGQFLNDMWIFDTITDKWKMSGSNKFEKNKRGNYKLLMIDGEARPGARARSASFFHSINSTLYLFGGSGYSYISISENYLSDMWSYSIEKKKWKYEGGSMIGDVRRLYKGNEFFLPEIGGRSSPVVFFDEDNIELKENVFIFGGKTPTIEGRPEFIENDLFQFTGYHYTWIENSIDFCIFILPIWGPIVLILLVLLLFCCCAYCILGNCSCSNKSNTRVVVVSKSGKSSSSSSFSFSKTKPVTEKKSFFQKMKEKNEERKKKNAIKKEKKKKEKEEKKLQQKHQEEYEKLQKEQEELESQQSTEEMAKIKINSDLFQIPMDEVELVTQIGQGGSGAVVFKARWKGKKVAFKVFKVKFLGSDQLYFDEFERELNMMTSIFHPNILQFYGSSLKPPRCGIVMEYCKHGSIYDYVLMAKHGDKPKLEFKEKVAMLRDVSSAMSYLHGRDILHRDLKWQNVLFDKGLNTKLMDFGLSRLVAKKSVQMTKLAGTCFYMAPEIARGGKYDTKVDVYSFGIMMWELFNENFEPYGEMAEGVELKVSNDPEFRPELTKKLEKKEFEWYKLLMILCWDHEPLGRPTFDDILKTLIDKKKNL